MIIGEALSRMIVQASERGILLLGFWPTRGDPEIAHLQFADDTIIFCDANEDQIRNVKAILLCFEAVSSLKVNFF